MQYYQKLLLSKIIILFTFLSTISSAHALKLEVPVDCMLGENCFIQNYVDRDSGDGAKDYRCGDLTYNGHKGTDFRVATLKEMKAGVAVLAAANGTIIGKRDGMPDIDYRKISRKILQGKECGNGVVIKHDDGIETQYCHMKKGSIIVTKGQKVKAGDKIGLIGLSGKTEFPHLHLSVRINSEPVDPFTGENMKEACLVNAKINDSSMWSKKAQSKVIYQSGGALTAGFTDHSPTLQEIIAGDTNTKISPDSRAMVFWTLAYGLKAGDRVIVRLTTPNNVEISRNEKFLDSGKAQMFMFAGKTRSNFIWNKGIYNGYFEVYRGGLKTISEQFSVTVF